MSIETLDQLKGLRRAGLLVNATLRAVAKAARPGVTTAELDAVAASVFKRNGARSGPILTYDYPGSICISVGDQVVHGVPGEQRLREGDLVSLDVAAELDGYHADAATTVSVGRPSQPGRRLVSATRACLRGGIRAARPGATLRDVGAAIEGIARKHGFEVVRELTGHGIGRAMHEPPVVFNWPSPEATQTLESGMVFTIEPMLVAGRPRVVVDPDGWTVRTSDRSLAAHEEHTIVVDDRGAIILTAA